MTTLPTTDYSGGGTKTVSMFSKLMQQSSSFVMEGVKNLVVKKHNLPVTKIVDELMEIKQGQFNEEYLYFDPKILRGQDNIPRAKNPFQVKKVHIFEKLHSFYLVARLTSRSEFNCLTLPKWGPKNLVKLCSLNSTFPKIIHFRKP